MAERVSQFAHPRGALGWLAGAVMAVENRQRNAFAISLLDVQPADHVLEIGFGPGVTIQRLAELVPRGSVTGVDSSSVMVGQARRRNAQAIQQGRVAIHHGSAASLPFPSRTRGSSARSPSTRCTTGRTPRKACARCGAC